METQLSRRERQIMDIIYTRGQASANAIAAELPDPPTSTAVRTFLRILQDKRLLRRRKVGREHIYSPTRPRRKAGQSALQRVVQTFFDGSLEQAVAAHLSDPAARPTDEELARLSELIRRHSPQTHRGTETDR
jgi:predicted transcriptional regulator